MLRSLTENFLSLFKYDTNETSNRTSGLKRKRPCDEFDNDPDVLITKVEKRRKIEHPVVGLLSKMANWIKAKPQQESRLFNGNDVKEHMGDVSSKTNGNLCGSLLNTDGTLSHVYRRNGHHYPTQFGNTSTAQSGGPSHHKVVSRRSSNTSSCGRSKPSTASACIRMKEKEQYSEMLKLQFQRFRSPWETKVDVATKSSVHTQSKVSISSSGNKSLFGSANLLGQSEASNESQSIPRYKTSAHSRLPIESNHPILSRCVNDNSRLSSILAQQRKVNLLRQTLNQSSNNSSGTCVSQGPNEPIVVENRPDSSTRTSPVEIIDSDDESSTKKSSTDVKDKTIKKSSPPEFLNNIYIKDDYIDDFNKRRKMQEEERKRQIEEQQLKVKAYSEKRRAQEIGLEKEMKYRMRIFDEEPEVSEEIFIGYPSDEEEETLPELTADMEQVIRTALRSSPPGEVLSKAFNLQITRADIATLGGLNWLNDEVINFYMNMLIQRGEQNGKAKVYAFNTFFYPKIMSGGHQAVRRWTKKVDIFAMKYILIPVHLGMHWCLCIANMQDKVITYYDSMGGRNHECLSAVRKYINDESVAKKQCPINMSEWDLVIAQDIPHQMNGSDCGMFSCKYAEYVTRGKEITFSQEDMPYFRRRMVYEIVSQQLLQ